LASPRTSRVLLPGVAHSRQAALLILAGLIAARSPLPYTAAAAIPLVWAGVELVLSIRDRAATGVLKPPAARGPSEAPERTPARAPAPGIAASIVGLLLVCLLTVTVLLPYAFYGTVKSLQDCTAGANTAIATRDCTATYNADLDPALRGFFRIGQRAGG
jgi:hypothetical protein